MTTEWIVYVCLAMGLLSALIAGVFQSFSDFIMRGLARSAPAASRESMNNINITVLRSLFLFSFFLLVPLSVVMSIYAQLQLNGLQRPLIVAGSIIYIATVFLLTIFANVPMNKKLGQFKSESAEADSYWNVYYRVWTRWNHVRTLGSVIAAICFLLAAVATA